MPNEQIWQTIGRPPRPNEAHYKALQKQANEAREIFYHEHQELSEFATETLQSRERALRVAIQQGRAVKVDSRWFVRREPNEAIR